MGRTLIATLAGLVMMAGCNVTRPLGQPIGSPLQTAATMRIQHQGYGSRLWAGLDLSDKQKAAIRDIVAKQRAAKCSKGMEADVDAEANLQSLKAALLAPEIDKVALSSAIRDKIAARGAIIDRWVMMLTQISDILTPEQRAKFAARKADDHGRSGFHLGHSERGEQHMQRLAAVLKLTDAQRAAFTAVYDAFAANKDMWQAIKKTKQDAVASFMQTGDATALKAALILAYSSRSDKTACLTVSRSGLAG
jgi:Spy/CpxP family protein refolding chaperone